MKLLKTTVVVAGMALAFAGCQKKTANVDENSMTITTENTAAPDVNAADMNATDMNATSTTTTTMNTTENATGNGTRTDPGPRG